MSDLSAKKCVPCEGGIDPLSREQAEALMKQLQPEWKLSDDAKSLHREWKFRNFYHTMSFVNAVAHIANAEDHHPDLSVSYDSVRVSYWTHAASGLTLNDFVCAAKVNALFSS